MPLRLALLGGHLVELGLGGDVALDQLALPVQFEVGELERRFGGLDAGLRLVDRRLVEAFLDDEQQFAVLDVGPSTNSRFSKKPSTRARRSTLSLASTRPVKVDDGRTSSVATLTTVTAGGGAAAAC